MIVYSRATKDMKIKDATWIQGGIGYVKGKPAEEIVVGDIIVWNGGYTSTVLKKLYETKSTITFEISGSDAYYDANKTYERKFGKKRIVAIDNLKEDRSL